MDIESFGWCLFCIKDKDRALWPGLWGFMTMGSNLGDRGEDRELLPNGIFEIDMFRRKEGRRMELGAGTTAPSRLA